MLLADFIAEHRRALIARWREMAEQRLGLDIADSELVNALPYFIDDLIEALRSEAGQWPDMWGARRHGRHRMRRGIDIGALTEEMMLVAELVIELAAAAQVDLPADQVARLLHAMGRGTAASVRAYAALRDREIVDQAAQHYSFVAHEVRSPLQTARLAASLLLERPEAERPRYFTRLDRALSHASELIDNSIAHARLNGKPRISPQPIDLAALVAGVCDDVEDQALARGITLVQVVEVASVEADRKLLTSALTNLVRNAIKFSCAGGRVAVRAVPREDGVLFEVEDACGGLPEELPPKLFQPFVQRSDDRSGFGLGLSIVKQAVEAHHGSVRVANRPGDGCTFVLDLPLRYEAPEPDGDGDGER